MQKIVCRLLIVWLVFISGCADVHAMNDGAAHEAQHTGYMAQLHSPADTAGLEVSDLSHADVCIHASCGHSSALLARLDISAVKNAQVDIPAFRQGWWGDAIANNIERPKWPLTTPAVVNLLG